MDIFTFISQIVSAVIWPLVTLFLAIQFKDPIADLLLKLSRIQHKDTVVDFGEQMDVLKEDAQAEGLARNSEKREALAEKERGLNTVAGISPSTAIMESWSEVESAVVKLIKGKGITCNNEGAAPYLTLQNILISNKLLENKKIKIYSDLRKLRNKVAHAADYEVNEVQAGEYINIAMNLIEVIESAKA